MQSDFYPRPVVAAVQAAPVYYDRDACLAKVRKYTAEARRQAADLVVFSESFIPGFPSWVHMLSPLDQRELYKLFTASAIEIPSPEFYELQDIAKTNQIFLSIGVTEKSTSKSIGVLWNTNLIFDREGNLIARHRKLMPTWGEKLMWSFGDGSTLNVHDTDIGRLGALICGENTNPLAKYALISQGEQIHISTYPACFPISRHPEKGSPYLETLKVRACAMSYEGKVFTIVSSQAMDEQAYYAFTHGQPELRDLLDRTTYGGSFIVAPSGVICSDILTDNREGIVYAECDLSSEIGEKAVHDVAGSYQREDVFHFHVNKTKLDPDFTEQIPYVPEEER